MPDVPGKKQLPDHAERMEAARAVARWHLGYYEWAETIVGAYLDPETAHEELVANKARFERRNDQHPAR